MILSKIWERYFAIEFTKLFCILILGFYSLYVLIDFSTRYSFYHSSGLSWFDIFGYYGYIFLQRVEILVPFAVVISGIRILCNLNIHREFIALLASGISINRLMRPFFLVISILITLLYVNAQWSAPWASKRLNIFESNRNKEKYKREQKINIHAAILPGHGVILFHGFDEPNRRYYDTYIITSTDEIFHVEYLYPYESPIRGCHVEKLTRDENGKLLPLDSYDTYIFQDLSFDRRLLRETLKSPSDYSLTRLWRLMPSFFLQPDQRQVKLATWFYRKITLPWLSLFAFLTIAPFCLQFTRNLPVFMLFLCGMLGVVVFYLILNASVILGENGLLHPLIAVCCPMFLLGALSITNYVLMAKS
ncbi:MAG: hypothetical protein Tsb0021_05820 [Chlamydiales bacterium]